MPPPKAPGKQRQATLSFGKPSSGRQASILSFAGAPPRAQGSTTTTTSSSSSSSSSTQEQKKKRLLSEARDGEVAENGVAVGKEGEEGEVVEGEHAVAVTQSKRPKTTEGRKRGRRVLVDSDSDSDSDGGEGKQQGGSGMQVDARGSGLGFADLVGSSQGVEKETCAGAGAGAEQETAQERVSQEASTSGVVARGLQVTTADKDKKKKKKKNEEDEFAQLESSSSDAEEEEEGIMGEEEGEQEGEAKVHPLMAVASEESVKFDPLAEATWKPGEPVPYLHLAKTFEKIEEETKRLKILEILSNCFRCVIATTPQDLLQCVYLTINQLAPAHHGVELGVGDGILKGALAEATGRTERKIREELENLGDLGLVAQASRSNQRTLFQAQPLTIRKVFSELRAIALETGKSVVQRKRNKIKSLLVACRDCEPKYLVRSLQGKLRIGLAEQGLVGALAQALVLTPPVGDPPRARGADLQNLINEGILLLKTKYSECPSWDEIVPVLLEFGLHGLADRVRITPGVPLKPMLAKPTKGISEVLDRFSEQEFTCEYKYDGERAQIHLLEDGTICIYSRNSENHTGKYPDLISVLPEVWEGETTSFIMDSEVVAWDRDTGEILPFQRLSTRARKDVKLEDIKVNVAIYAFDLLFYNNQSLLRETLKERRRILFSAFREVPGKFRFATHMEASDTEAIQDLLMKAIEDKCEGLMVKSLDKGATYEPAQRSMKWLKVKKDYMAGLTDSLDLVPIGAYMGQGKRAGVLGAYLLACYDDEQEEFQAICKIGTGFSEERLAELTTFFREHQIKEPKSYFRFPESANKPDVWLDPVTVWEVMAADLSLSPIYKAAIGLADPSRGIALRFPRLVRIREDKDPEQATSAQQVAEMYLNQKSVSSSSAGSREPH